MGKNRTNGYLKQSASSTITVDPALHPRSPRNTQINKLYSDGKILSCQNNKNNLLMLRYKGSFFLKGL